MYHLALCRRPQLKIVSVALKDEKKQCGVAQIPTSPHPHPRLNYRACCLITAVAERRCVPPTCSFADCALGAFLYTAVRCFWCAEHRVWNNMNSSTTCSPRLSALGPPHTYLFVKFGSVQREFFVLWEHENPFGSTFSRVQSAFRRYPLERAEHKRNRRRLVTAHFASPSPGSRDGGGHETRSCVYH